MFDPDAMGVDSAPRWTGWSRRLWNADWWLGPVPVGKTLAAAGLIGGIAQWL